MLDQVAVAFLIRLVKVVPGLVGNWIETRNAIRVEHTKARMTILTEEQRHRNAIELHQIEILRQEAASYPLGMPGRLRTLLGSSGLPTILISPPPPNSPISVDDVVYRTREMLTEYDDFTAYAQLPSGAFARDAGVSRFVDGELAARALAELEFGSDPAIIIYFESGSYGLTAHAFLSTVFGSTGGGSGFSFSIARYGLGRPSGAPPISTRNSDLPSWYHIDLSDLPDADPVDVVAYTITLFLLVVVDTYWQMKAGVAPGLLAQAGVGKGVEISEPESAEATTALAYFLPELPLQRARLELDARQLAKTGSMVTAEELADGYVGLHIQGDRDMIFVVDAEYPSSPPVVIRVDDTFVWIGATDWSPECTLNDIVEALR